MGPHLECCAHVLCADEWPQLLGVDLLLHLLEQHTELLNLLLTLASSTQVSSGLEVCGSDEGGREKRTCVWFVSHCMVQYAIRRLVVLAVELGHVYSTALQTIWQKVSPAPEARH